MTTVVVIGAGLGGLATAIRLSHRGYDVTVIEKNERVGGKMNIMQCNGYTFDTGPSLLTMPFVVRDLFASTSRRIEDYVDLEPIEPICRYNFADGSTIDATNNIEGMGKAIAEFSPADAHNFVKFVSHGKRIYDASAEPFLFQPFGSLDAAGLARNLKHLPAILKLDAFRTLNDAVESFFVSPHLRQLFNRFATYNGSSPYHAPATLAIIPYIEFAFGGWHVRGGMYKLAEALERLALECGVKFRLQEEVEEIVVEGSRVEGVRLASGDHLFADVVVCNADALYAREKLLPNPAGKNNAIEPSLGGFVLLLGVKKQFAQLSHHNIFFSADYKAEFDQMFEHSRPAADPTIYVCNPMVTEPLYVPEGSSSLFVLVNAPPLKRGENGHASQLVFDWEREKRNYRDLIVHRLEAAGLANLESSIEVERIITPLDFERTYNAYRGSIYGTSSNSRMAAFVRPANKSKEIEGLYYVGGSSHPGGGIPLVLLSGNIVSDMIHRQVGVA